MNRSLNFVAVLLVVCTLAPSALAVQTYLNQTRIYSTDLFLSGRTVLGNVTLPTSDTLKVEGSTLISGATQINGSLTAGALITQLALGTNAFTGAVAAPNGYFPIVVANTSVTGGTASFSTGLFSGLVTETALGTNAFTGGVQAPNGYFPVLVSNTSITGGTLAFSTSTNKLSSFASTTSAELAGVISDETGSGALVFANSPALTGDVTGVRYVGSGKVVGSDGYFPLLTANTSITGGTLAFTTSTNTLASFASTTSAQLAGVVSDETGSGALVFANSPAFTGDVTGVRYVGTGKVVGSDGYFPFQTVNTSLSLPALSKNSVLFINSTSGLVDQDITNFQWNSSTRQLSLGLVTGTNERLNVRGNIAIETATASEEMRLRNNGGGLSVDTNGLNNLIQVDAVGNFQAKNSIFTSFQVIGANGYFPVLVANTSATIGATGKLVLTPTVTASLPSAVQGGLVFDSTTNQFKVGVGASPAYDVVGTLGTAQTWTAKQTFSSGLTVSGGDVIASASGAKLGFFGSAGATKQTITLTSGALTDNSGGTSGFPTIASIVDSGAACAGTCPTTASVRNAVATIAAGGNKNTADILSLRNMLCTNYGLCA